MSVVLIGINGFTPVGRAVFFATLMDPTVSVGVINDVSCSTEFIAYALEHERPAGVPAMKVETYGEDNLLINGTQKVLITHTNDMRAVGWGNRQIAVVVECSGTATTKERCWGHLTGGAAAVVIAAQSVDAPVIVPGINDVAVEKGMPVVCAGSFLGAALAPFLQFLCKTVGVEEVSYTAIHGPQPVDPTAGRSADPVDWRQTRLSSSASSVIVPYHHTGLSTLQKVLPQLRDKICGSAFQVPVQQGCAVDLFVRTTAVVSKDQLDASIAQVASDPTLAKCVAVHTPKNYVISSDCIGSRRVIYEQNASVTNPSGNTHKLLLWIDLYALYAQRLLDLATLAAGAMCNNSA